MFQNLNSFVLVLLGVTLVVAVGCGDDDRPAPDAAVMMDAGMPDTGPPADTGPPMMMDAGDIQCTMDGVVAFRAFDRTCTMASECGIGMLQVDCCGSMLATGIKLVDEPAYAEAAGLCATMYPDCECRESPLRADDGTADVSGTLSVDCVGMACRTGFR